MSGSGSFVIFVSFRLDPKFLPICRVILQSRYDPDVVRVKPQAVLFPGEPHLADGPSGASWAYDSRGVLSSFFSYRYSFTLSCIICSASSEDWPGVTDAFRA